MPILTPLFIFILIVWSITCMALPFFIYWLVRARKEWEKLNKEIDKIDRDLSDIKFWQER